MSNVILIESDEDGHEKQQKYDAAPSRKRHRRKSVLVVRPNPEVQFESISPDSDCIPFEKPRPDLVSTVRTPTVEMVGQINRKLMERQEIHELMHKIAEERLRINSILTAMNVPKIDFQLYTRQHVLKQEIEQRININLDINIADEET